MNRTAGSAALVTTIITTHRRPRLLKRAILSVLGQTYPHFQACVYDDASDDGTASVVAEIAKLDHRVKYYCHSYNIGADINHVYGAQHVDTPYFSFLDDDDIVLPEFYEIAMKGFERYPDAMFSAMEVILLDFRGNLLGISGSKWEPGLYQPPNGLKAMLKFGHITWTGTLYRREVIDQIRCIEGNGSDMYFAMTLAARWPFVVTRTPGAIFYRSLDLSDSPVERDVSRWMSIIQRVKEDRTLPLSIRSALEHWVMKLVRNHVFRVVLESIVMEREEQYWKASGLLRNDLGLLNTTRALSLIKWLCERSALMRHGMTVLGRMVRYLRTRQAVGYVNSLGAITGKE